MGQWEFSGRVVHKKRAVLLWQMRDGVQAYRLGSTQFYKANAWEATLSVVIRFIACFV